MRQYKNQLKHIDYNILFFESFKAVPNGQFGNVEDLLTIKQLRQMVENMIYGNYLKWNSYSGIVIYVIYSDIKQ